jgi:hypothetical protein
LTTSGRREQRVVDLLDEWPWEKGGVTIGGYAVMAYGPPRYSSDIDIVVPEGTLPVHERWLVERTFSKRRVYRTPVQNFAGSVVRFCSEDVDIDLLEGFVRDREAKVDVPERWIARDARMMKLTTMNKSTRNAVRVARPEALWALKLQSGRDLDLSDLFAISPEPFDYHQIVELFVQLRTDSLRDKLIRVEKRLQDPKLYVDSLTRRGLGSPSLTSNRVNWARFVELSRAIIRGSLGS